VLALKSGVWQFIHFDHFLRRCSYTYPAAFEQNIASDRKTI